MVTLDTVYTLASEMLDAGKQDASPHLALKLALWGAILSANNSIDRNGMQLDCLRPYVHGLPWNIAAITDIVGACGFPPSPIQARGILLVDIHATLGDYDGLECMPASGREWVAWRKRVAREYGLAWKTSSMAALLLWPFSSPFAVIDRHVCRRLAATSPHPAMEWYKRGFSKLGKAGYRRYRMLERYVWQECRKECGSRHVNLALYHWYAWEKQRASEGLNYGRIGASHASLCAYYWQ